MSLKNKKLPAFTLLEILVVIAIIGILSVVTAIGLSGVRAHSRDTKRVADIKQMQTALKMYQLDHKKYPTTAEWGNQIATGSNVYLKSVPVPPNFMDGECGTSSAAYVYESDGKQYSIKYCTGTKVGDILPGLKILSSSGNLAYIDGSYVPPVEPPADSVRPVITLIGSASVTIEAGTTYTDAGATALDNVDGVITNSIVVVNPVNINTPGTYTITYNVKDSANNSATQVTRTVIVQESQVPSVKTWRVVINSSIPGTGSTGNRKWYFVDMSSDGQKILAGTVGGYLYISSNGGENFSELTSLGSRVAWRCGVSDNGLSMIASQNDAAYYPQVSLDGGITWNGDTAAEKLLYIGVAISDNGSVRLGSVYKGYPRVSLDSGLSWSTAGSYAYHHNASCSSDCSKMLVVAGGGYPAISTDSGATWSQKAALNTAGWYGSTVSGNGTKMAVSSIVYSSEPKIYVSTDMGVTWINRAPLTNRNWVSVSYSANGSFLAAADWGGYLYTSIDDGQNWEQQTSMGVKDWRSIAVANNGKIVAVVDNGDIYIYD